MLLITKVEVVETPEDYATLHRGPKEGFPDPDILVHERHEDVHNALGLTVGYVEQLEKNQEEARRECARMQQSIAHKESFIRYVHSAPFIERLKWLFRAPSFAEFPTKSQ